MYRLHIENFNLLLNDIRHEITTENVEMAIRSSGSEVCAEVRLAATLRYLAGGSVWDIRIIFGLSVYEFYRSVWRVVDAIHNHKDFKVEFPIDDVGKLQELERVFRAKSSHGLIRGCVGAIDGCLIWQKNHSVAVHNPRRDYSARKEKYALLLMAIADAIRRITFFDISRTPTTHDSLAQGVANAELPHQFFFSW